MKRNTKPEWVGDCVAENHYQLFYNLAHKYGLGIHPESGEPHSAPVDALKVMGVSDFPQGEFWAVANTHRIKDDERLSVRQSACFAGTHLNPNVTWWKQSKDFISYLDRSSFLLQQGLFVADVLYYYGDDVPNSVFLKEDFPELNFGYDWDGMSYRVMMLTPDKAIDLVLKKVESLVNKGMTAVSPRPENVTGLTGFPESDRELKAITDRLWGKLDRKALTENKVGKGRVIWGQNINDVLAGMKIKPDFEFKSNQEKTALDYIHRTTNTEEIYFVANRFARKGINDLEFRYLTNLPDRYEQVECTFRVNGKVPQLWNPKTGEMKEILTYREENGQTIVPLHLEPEGSVFVVFKDAPAQKHVITIQKEGKNWFPGNQFETKETAYIDLFNQGEKKMVSIYEPGIYNLTWSEEEGNRSGREIASGNSAFRKMGLAL